VKKVILFGTGSVAGDVFAYLTHDSPYEVVAFAIDREFLEEETLFDLPVVPFEEVESFYPPSEYKMHIAVGYVRVNRLRAERYHQAKEKGYELTSYVSSKATIWPGSTIGENCLIGANSIVSASAQIGNNVVIGSGCIVPHRTVIKDHCFVGSGVTLSGFVTVEPYCFLGTGAIARNNIAIARECVIGAGALILEDTEERGVYMGKPADLLPLSSDKLPIG
jgi:sugar O-acyltransferase (sialic acid O-acetyltransferase NeuD family)